MLKLRSIFAFIAAVLLPAAAFAQQTGAAPATGHATWDAGDLNAPFIRAVLLYLVWIVVAAIVLGPLVKWWLGDLWERRTAQPYADDTGDHH